MSTVFYTSDLHLGHGLMAELRGFNGDIQAHDKALAERWDATVSKRDTVWILGDLCMSKTHHAFAWIAERPGAKRFVWGNHDAGHPMHYPSASVQRSYLEVFDSAEMAGRRRIAGVQVLLSHFPYDADREAYESSRYPQWRLPNRGEWLLHGHTHEKTIRTSPREIHVGVDAWNLTPVAEYHIAKLIGDST
jgi:calcineurin-like phosphoesterase family protein